MSMSVVIPTLNAARSLPATLAALGDVDEIVVTDGGSTDDTVAVAADFGARIVTASAGRGNQLIVGEHAAHHAWLLFLHADTVLETGWREEVERFVSDPGNAQRAATFHFALDDEFARGKTTGTGGSLAGSEARLAVRRSGAAHPSRFLPFTWRLSSMAVDGGC